MPGEGCRNAKTGVEMYGNARFFTMTGQRFNDAPMEIAEDNGALAWIHATYVKPAKAKKSRSRQKTAEPLSDEDLLEKARAPGSPTNPQIRWGGNSGGAAFGKLWAGDWQGDFGSQSEADLALCYNTHPNKSADLPGSPRAFWSGKNREQMERLFRQSGLIREKWDERHHASGATYGDETLDRAIDGTEDSYGRDDAPVFCYEGCNSHPTKTAVFAGTPGRRKGDNIYPLTNFVVQPVEMIVSDDETQMTADLLTVRGEVICEQIMCERV